jgi:thiamine biosynthesis protein ThiS
LNASQDSTSQRTSPSVKAFSIRVNGEARALADGASVADVVAALGLGGRKLAVAVNREVVPRARHALHLLRDGDRVEILEAVGGG